MSPPKAADERIKREADVASLRARTSSSACADVQGDEHAKTPDGGNTSCLMERI